MSGYSELKFWSPVLGTDAARLSLFNDRGHEFFMIVPDSGDRSYREARETALDMISTAIRIGCEPGEVRSH